MEEYTYVACFPTFCLHGYPVKGVNGTVDCLPNLESFFSMFHSDFIFWAYREGRTEECKIPPILDHLPEGFNPCYAIFSWVQSGVMVNADERGIFIGNQDKQYLISVTDSGAILPQIKLIVTPLEEMANVARETFMKFFPEGPPKGLQ